jgi:hypothetical protein
MNNYEANYEASSEAEAEAEEEEASKSFQEAITAPPNSKKKRIPQTTGVPSYKRSILGSSPGKKRICHPKEVCEEVKKKKNISKTTVHTGVNHVH